MKPKVRRVVRAAVYGVLTQALAFYVVYMTGGAAGPWVAWNMWLALEIAQPKGEIVQGLPPWLAIAVIVGLVVGVATYSTAIYFALRALEARVLRRSP